VKCEGLDGGAEAWVPVELVFQQESLSKAQRALALSRAESSGMAAYTTIEGAIERGLLELIERDAFMVNWIARRATPAIAPATLPGDIARRLAALERAGFRVAFKDLSLETVPVVLAFGQAEALHQTVVATAAAYDAEAALNHALSELEASAATAIAGGAVPSIEPAAVCTPADHLQLYKQRRYFRSADWIGSDTKTAPLKAIGSGRPRSFDELSRKLRTLGYRALWRDMTLPGASLHQGSTRLHIARVLVPGLVPISFGFGTEALGLSRLANFGAAATPRGRKPRFPHPFA
jgi:ribosomal protein S12 methylthiotransferase accessory factor